MKGDQLEAVRGADTQNLRPAVFLLGDEISVEQPRRNHR